MTSDKTPSAAPTGRAVDLMRNGIFPDWWTFVPVAGKATWVEQWSTRPLTRGACLEAYDAKTAYRGLGVVTGEFSGGLIALDIDGPDADARWHALVGDAYEAAGEESTMSWTSGLEGRRQVLYRVPASVVPELRHVKTLILRNDGQWHLGQSDVERQAGTLGVQGEGGKYQEVVLRFNQCQSVVPGSPHPDTKKRYRFLNYNGGEVALAPEWVMDVLRSVRKPVQWLSDADQKALDAEFGETAVPSRQIRGWFFKEEVQNLLRPRLEELVFRHQVFDTYGWRTRDGGNPQRMSGCPWHGGRSGTAFQYSMESGCWDCKACGVGGDVLDFVHKVTVNNLYAERPQGPDLEAYVAEIATALGFDYPACAKVVQVTTKEEPVRRLTGHDFFKAAQRIDEAFDNAELGDYHLMELVRDSGLSNVYRSGPQVRMALERFLLHETQIQYDPAWQENVRGQRDYLIPDFVSKPSSIMLHARGGMGKTRLAVLLAKIVGRREAMKVRGLTVRPTTSGNVLFIGSDMSLTDYAEYFDQQEIDTAGPDKWLHFRPHWQQSQYKVLVRWLNEIKPVLVVVDSLTSVSTLIAAKENEAEYAHTLYRLARENGDKFPATTFLWIHHNTKDGGSFRGTDTLRNAVHETWELKALTDEQRVEFGDNALILQIDKSRGMRGGDRFLVKEDIEEALSLEDLTPTVTKGNNGLGDETPRTMVLGILKEAEQGLTLKEVRYELNSRLAGRRGEGSHVSARTVERWINRWVSAGLVEATSVRRPGQERGRPATVFRALSLVRPSDDDEKVSETPEIDSAAVDLNFRQIFDNVGKNPRNVEKHGGVADGTGGTVTGFPEGDEEVTEAATSEAPRFFDTSKGVSKNHSPEMPSETGVSKSGQGFFDSSSPVKEDPRFRGDDIEMPPFDFG